MCGACAPAIDPIGITQLVDEETLPGVVHHLFRDRAAQLLVSPAGGEVRKTDVLLWTCTQGLMTIGVSSFAYPVRCHTLPVNNSYMRHGISQLCQHHSFRRDRDCLWSSPHNQQCRYIPCSMLRRGVARGSLLSLRFLGHKTLSLHLCPELVCLFSFRLIGIGTLLQFKFDRIERLLEISDNSRCLNWIDDTLVFLFPEDFF